MKYLTSSSNCSDSCSMNALRSWIDFSVEVGIPVSLQFMPLDPDIVTVEEDIINGGDVINRGGDTGGVDTVLVETVLVVETGGRDTGGGDNRGVVETGGGDTGGVVETGGGDTGGVCDIDRDINVEGGVNIEVSTSLFLDTVEVSSSEVTSVVVMLSESLLFTRRSVHCLNIYVELKK